MEINEICQALPIIIKTQKVEWSDNRNGNLSHPKYSDEVLNWINQFGTLNIADKDYIDNIEQIDRGYEHIEARLNALGAKIIRG